MSAEAWGFLGVAVTAIATLMGGLGVAWIQFARRTSRVEQSVSGVEEATKQLRPNGGSHLADAIHRIESKVDMLQGAFEQHCRENPR